MVYETSESTYLRGGWFFLLDLFCFNRLIGGSKNRHIAQKIVAMGNGSVRGIVQYIAAMVIRKTLAVPLTL